MITSALNHTFSMWSNAPFENCTLPFGPKDCVPIQKMELDFARSMSWNTQPNCREFFKKATEPLPPIFFDFIFGWPSASVHEYALFPEFASRLCSVMWTFGKGAKNYMADSNDFHWNSLCTVFDIASQTESSLWQTFLSKNVSHRFSSAVLEQERMSALIFHVCSHRGGNHKRLHLCTVLVLSIALSFLSADWCPCRDSFMAWSIGLWSSDPNYSSPQSSISGCSVANHDVQHLFRSMPTQFWVDQAHVCVSSTSFP